MLGRNAERSWFRVLDDRLVPQASSAFQTDNLVGFGCICLGAFFIFKGPIG